ncbi:MAG: hypothetical protein KGH87_02415 [Thaumarchaeota archaeon]|nr:hypothetical protein [Nitrososphaerota archaeon]MDE1838752.1 hypothetical protein [Nitrososphaerota archaeon]
MASVLILNLMYPTKVLADDNMTEWNVQHVIGKFLYSNPPKPDQIFNLQYRVINGTLGNLTEDQHGQFISKVQSTDQGMLELRIPRNYPYSNMDNTTSNRDDVAKASTVIDVNGIGLDSRKYSFVATDCFREYSIPFSKNAIITLGFMVYPEHIPFHGDAVPDHCMAETTVIPEFPFAIPVFIISITSLIIFYRMKFK